MKKQFATLFIGLAACLQAAALQAMPERDQGDLGKLIEQQNSAFREGEFDLALALNMEMEEEFKKLFEQSPDILEEWPDIRPMIMFDRAVILDSLGLRPEALELLKGAYASGDLEELSLTVPYPAYYGDVLSSYIDWLREDGDDGWREVQDRFIERLSSYDPPQRFFSLTPPPSSKIHASSYIGEALIIRRDAGDLERAKEICRGEVERLANIKIELENPFFEPGMLPVNSVDESGRFIIGLAFRLGRLPDWLNYAQVDMHDSCAGTYELEGDLKKALEYRTKSRDLVETEKPKQFLPLIDLRLARLFAYLGDEQQADIYLSSSLAGYAGQHGTEELRVILCQNLAFNLSKREVSANDVWDKVMVHSSTAASMGRLNCS